MPSAMGRTHKMKSIQTLSDSDPELFVSPRKNRRLSVRKTASNVHFERLLRSLRSILALLSALFFDLSPGKSKSSENRAGGFLNTRYRAHRRQREKTPISDGYRLTLKKFRASQVSHLVTRDLLSRIGRS
jgi:hypothetical protein